MHPIPKGTNWTFSISTTGDSQWFMLNQKTNSLFFMHQPDFSSPLDLDGNNLYEVSGEVSDGQLKTPFNLRIQKYSIQMQMKLSYQIPFRLRQKILTDGARVPGLVISSVLITHGYIIHIWDGFMPVWMRTILSFQGIPWLALVGLFNIFLLLCR